MSKRKLHISKRTADLLDIYATRYGDEIGMKITREQALERMVQVFVGNPLAAKRAREKQAVPNG